MGTFGDNIDKKIKPITMWLFLKGKPQRIFWLGVSSVIQCILRVNCTGNRCRRRQPRHFVYFLINGNCPFYLKPTKIDPFKYKKMGHILHCFDNSLVLIHILTVFSVLFTWCHSQFLGWPSSDPLIYYFVGEFGSELFKKFNS